MVDIKSNNNHTMENAANYYKNEENTQLANAGRLLRSINIIQKFSLRAQTGPFDLQILNAQMFINNYIYVIIYILYIYLSGDTINKEVYNIHQERNAIFVSVKLIQCLLVHNILIPEMQIEHIYQLYACGYMLIILILVASKYQD